MQRYKEIEQQHYENAARARGGVEASDDLRSFGSTVVAPELRRPYVDFEAAIRSRAGHGAAVLDLGAGTGVHSLAGLQTGARAFATDIAPAALALALKRAAASGAVLHAAAADAERLPFRDEQFDVVTTAGSLYCLDLERVMAEVSRLLKPGGSWIIVDSFDVNPIFRLNRFIGYLAGRRTRRAVTNIPDHETLATLRRGFGGVDVRFYGAFTPLAPLARLVVGASNAAKMLDAADRLIGPPAALAFKFVAVATGPKKKSATLRISLQPLD